MRSRDDEFQKKLESSISNSSFLGEQKNGIPAKLHEYPSKIVSNRKHEKKNREANWQNWRLTADHGPILQGVDKQFILFLTGFYAVLYPFGGSLDRTAINCSQQAATLAHFKKHGGFRAQKF